MPEIIVKYADKIVERVVTEKEHITIGRTSDNDIVLDNRGVSRRHAQIEFSDNGALLIDNDSLNGTFVNQRKVTEQALHDSDTITIGKFDLVFYSDTQPTRKMSDMDGTMILNTKKQKELVEQDRADKEITGEVGASTLLSLDSSRKEKFPLNQETITLGKGGFVDIRVKGFWVSRLQAKITKEADAFRVVNVGRSDKMRLNGELVASATLKNGDILEIGKSAFRFIEG